MLVGTEAYNTAFRREAVQTLRMDIFLYHPSIGGIPVTCKLALAAARVAMQENFIAGRLTQSVWI